MQIILRSHISALLFLFFTASIAPLSAWAQDHKGMVDHSTDNAPGRHTMKEHNMEKTSLEGKKDHSDSMHQMHMSMGNKHSSGVPTLAGQDAFGAIQEILKILEADANTDWAKVNITALRDHLVDMNHVTLNAEVEEIPHEGGIKWAIRGKRRTRAAIQRMTINHAPELSKLGKWKAEANITSHGAELIVTSLDPKELLKIRALGFMGVMATGAHHQPHHLGMARGDMVHTQ